MALPTGLVRLTDDVVLYGVVLGLELRDPTFPVEIERAPDDGLGSPDTANSEFFTVPAGQGQWTDSGLPAADDPWHYRGRHIRDGYLDGAWTPWVAVKPVRLGGPSVPPSRVSWRRPEIQVAEVRGATSSTVTIDVEDPELRVTAIQYKKRDGTEGGDTLDSTWQTAWTTSTGTIGTDVVLQRTLDVPVDPGLEGEMQWRVQFEGPDSQLFIVGDSFRVVHLEEATATITFPHTNLLPRTQANFWNYSIGALDASGTADPMFFRGTVIMPPGVTLTAWEVDLYRGSTADFAEITLYETTNPGLGTGISVLTHTTTGWQTLVDSGINVLVDANKTYWLNLELDGDVNGSNTRFARAKFTYTRPAYQYTY